MKKSNSDLTVLPASTWWRVPDYILTEDQETGESYVCPAQLAGEPAFLIEYDPGTRDASGVPGGDLLADVYQLGRLEAEGRAEPADYLRFARRYGLFGVWWDLQARGVEPPQLDYPSGWRAEHRLSYGESVRAMGRAAKRLARMMDEGREGHPIGEESRALWGPTHDPPQAYPVGLTLLPEGAGWRLGFSFSSLFVAVAVYWMQSQTTHTLRLCDRCGRPFFTTLGGHDRRWCSTPCKNTARTARYRARKKEAQS